MVFRRDADLSARRNESVPGLRDAFGRTGRRGTGGPRRADPRGPTVVGDQPRQGHAPHADRRAPGPRRCQSPGSTPGRRGGPAFASHCSPGCTPRPASATPRAEPPDQSSSPAAPVAASTTAGGSGGSGGLSLRSALPSTPLARGGGPRAAPPIQPDETSGSRDGSVNTRITRRRPGYTGPVGGPGAGGLAWREWKPV